MPDALHIHMVEGMAAPAMSPFHIQVNGHRILNNAMRQFIATGTACFSCWIELAYFLIEQYMKHEGV